MKITKYYECIINSLLIVFYLMAFLYLMVFPIFSQSFDIWMIFNPISIGLASLVLVSLAFTLLDMLSVKKTRIVNLLLPILKNMVLLIVAVVLVLISYDTLSFGSYDKLLQWMFLIIIVLLILIDYVLRFKFQMKDFCSNSNS